MMKLKNRVLTLILAGLMAGQAILPVSAAEITDAAQGTEDAEPGIMLIDAGAEQEEQTTEATPTETQEDVADNTETPNPAGETTGAPIDENAGEAPTEDLIQEPAEDETIEIETAEDPAAETETDKIVEDDIVTESTSDDVVQILVDTEDTGEQTVISLPDGYVDTDDLTTPTAGAQKNGRDSGASENGQLVKTAEWTDYDAGEGEITLTYAVPDQATPTTAVYAFGTCARHGFNKNVAVTQILELLEKYDQVDVITTMTYDHYTDQQDAGVSYLDFMNTSENTRSKKVQFTLKSEDGVSKNKDTLNSKLTVHTETSGAIEDDAIFCPGGAAHVTGTALINYLSDYFKAGNDPTAVYVLLDGSRAFSMTDGAGAHPEMAQKSDETMIANICYHASRDQVRNMSYSDLAIDETLIQKLADYQLAGQYYVLISDFTDYQAAYYGNQLQKMFCYASFAFMFPYEFQNNQSMITDYLTSDTGSKPYKEFSRVGQPIYYYNESLSDNGATLIKNAVTITDKIQTGLAVKTSGITATVNGASVDSKYVNLSVIDQTVRVSVANIQIGDVVNVKIPFTVTGGSTGGFANNNSFKDTNDGNATVVAADGKTVSVASPKLYKGAFKITTEAVNGTITDDIVDVMIGSSETIKYQPNDGYVLQSVTVDGESVDPKTYPDSYTFENITSDHSIKVVYEPTYRITTEVVNGTIDPSVTGLLTGENKEITYSPNSGCILDSVTVDNELVDISVYSKAYEFQNITADHLIKVVYARVEAPVKVVYDENGKDINGDILAVGDTVSYRITVKNPASVAKTFTITDKVPAGMEFVSAANNGSCRDGVVTWTQTVDANGELTVSFKAKAVEKGRHYTNSADAAVDDVKVTTNEVENWTLTNPVKSVLNANGNDIDGEEVSGGDELTYTIEIKNPSSKAVTATITDKLPDYVTFVSADNDGKESNGTVTWKINLKANETGKVSVKVEANETTTQQTITNKATVSMNDVTLNTNEVTNYIKAKVIKTTEETHKTVNYETENNKVTNNETINNITKNNTTENNAEEPVTTDAGAVITGYRNVNTGDMARTGLLLAIAGAAAVGLGIYYYKRRH